MDNPPCRLQHPSEARHQVCAALLAEQAATPVALPFRASEVEACGEHWRVKPELPKDARARRRFWSALNEGHPFTWTDSAGRSQRSEVVALEPEAEILCLVREVDAQLEPGTQLQPDSVDFIEPVLRLWNDVEWRDAMDAAWEAAVNPRPTSAPRSAVAAPFGWLRGEQAEALGLAEERIGFLWGPPGSGKTTTVGAAIASALLCRPGLRVLLVAPTNAAVDLALVATDQALERAESSKADSMGLRWGLRRIGRQAKRDLYRDRQHLLLATGPDAESRREMQRALAEAPVVAMTAARALLEVERLRELPRFDWLVVDEASQLPLSHALVLAPLAKATLFAGDPAQLAPVTRANTALVAEWVGESAFAWPERSVGAYRRLMLHEQARMAEPICEVVGRAFYDEKLSVCSKALVDSEWQSRRKKAAAGRGAFEVVAVRHDARYSGSRGGPVRESSALAVTREIERLLADLGPKDLWVLTPYHAQARLIREQLRARKLPPVAVSTVHRAQGGERLVVLFDPVNGSSPFLAGRAGARLLNVAMSRAEGRLVLFLSGADLSAAPLAFLATAGGVR